ncbi:MAG TPA: hypothetical protein VFE54_00710 [Mucilaginibacter sp.]|jgi:hypothetical protein|nr:hypothetical protein [Mucilaginibacter sp.]
MNHNVFLLATDPSDPCRDVIHARDTGLKLRVFCLDHEPFHPQRSEIQLYGSANGKWFAFETIGVTSDEALDVVEAIRWYAGYIDCPEMDIVPDDPRLDKDLAM